MNTRNQRSERDELPEGLHHWFSDRGLKVLFVEREGGLYWVTAGNDTEGYLHYEATFVGDVAVAYEA